MLTYNDEVLENAFDLFKDIKDTTVKPWGFTNVGPPKNEVIEVIQPMSNAEKTTYLEVVSLTEEGGLGSAKLAVEPGVDILMGTVSFDSINECLKDKSLVYYSSPSYVHSHPSVLERNVGDIVAHAQQLESNGVDGLDLLTYRYTGDVACLLHAVVESRNGPIVSAGRIASYECINESQLPRHGGLRLEPPSSKGSLYHKMF